MPPAPGATRSPTRWARTSGRDRAAPTRGVCQVDRVLGAEAVALEVRGTALAEPLVERLLYRRHVAFLHQDARDVRTADRPRPRLPAHGFHRDGDPVLVERF